jgi:hypothetical protein
MPLTVCPLYIFIIKQFELSVNFYQKTMYDIKNIAAHAVHYMKFPMKGGPALVQEGVKLVGAIKVQILRASILGSCAQNMIV